jgi:putative redox protein
VGGARVDNGAMNVVVRDGGPGVFDTRVSAGRHEFAADEPVPAGGADAGPSPYDLLLAALGTCTVMTLRLYAQRRSYPLTGITVELGHDRIHAEDCATCDTTEGRLDRIRRRITLDGDLTAAQRADLLRVADRCPVHRTLTSEVVIESVETL